MALKTLVNKLYYKLYCKFRAKQRALEKQYFNEFIKPKFVADINFKHIATDINVIHPTGLRLGLNVHIQRGAHIDARAGVYIGNHTHISRNLTIYSTNHNYSGKRLPYDDTLIGRSVIIGKSVWIGMNVNITPGVTIGDGAIIAMGSTITKDVKPGEIVASGKQQKISTRDMAHYYDLSTSKQFSGSSGKVLNAGTIPSIDTIPIFVLSTGRSGTTCLASLFDGHPQAIAEHETFYPILESLVVQHCYKQISHEQLKEILSSIISAKLEACNKKMYLLSDQKLLFFVDILHELYPDSKFIWLLRDPYQFAVSSASRGWYETKNRINIINNKPQIDLNKRSHQLRDMTLIQADFYTENPKISELEQGLEYWKHANLYIETAYDVISEDQKIRLNLEKLNEQKQALSEWLKIPIINETIKINQVSSKDQNRYKRMQMQINKLQEKRHDINELLKRWS